MKTYAENIEKKNYAESIEWESFAENILTNICLCDMMKIQKTNKCLQKQEKTLHFYYMVCII